MNLSMTSPDYKAVGNQNVHPFGKAVLFCSVVGVFFKVKMRKKEHIVIRWEKTGKVPKSHI